MAKKLRDSVNTLEGGLDFLNHIGIYLCITVVRKHLLSFLLLEYAFVQFPFDVFFEVFCFVLFRRMAKECAEATR